MFSPKLVKDKGLFTWLFRNETEVRGIEMRAKPEIRMAINNILAAIIFSDLQIKGF